MKVNTKRFISIILSILSICSLLITICSCSSNGYYNASYDMTTVVNEYTKELQIVDIIEDPISTLIETTGLEFPEELFEGNENSKDEVSFVYATVALDLISCGYDVFNAKIENEDINSYGIAYCDYEDGYILDNDDKIYISTGYFSFDQNNEAFNQDIITLNPIDNDGNEIINPEYSYVIGFKEEGIPNGHFILNSKYVKYSVDDITINIETFDNNSENYDFSLGSIYDYDTNDYEYIPYSEINSDPITYVPLTENIDYEAIKSEFHKLIDEQDKNGFSLESITVAFISLDALNALQGVLSQEDSLNGLSYEYLNSLEYDNERQYLNFNEDGTLTIKDFPPLPKNDYKTLTDWLIDSIIIAGCACVAVVSMTFLGPAGVYIAGAFIGAGFEYFNQTILQGKRIDDVNWASVGIMAVSGALKAAIPCSAGGWGILAAGAIGGVSSGTVKAVEGGTPEEILKSAAIGAAVSAVCHGLFRHCFPEGTKVMTIDGLVNIENISTGTLVASYNHITNRVEYKRVIKTFSHTTNDLVKIRFTNGEEIISTREHPYFDVATETYVPACELTNSSILLNYDGSYSKIDELEMIESDDVIVYNFNVEDNHNYFVGEDSILVHNVCRTKAVRDAWKIENNLAKEGLPSKYAWSSKELLELQKYGKISGYQGHHIIPVNELIGTNHEYLISSADDIVFLSNAQHSYVHQLGDTFLETKDRLLEIVPWLAERIENLSKIVFG